MLFDLFCIFEAGSHYVAQADQQPEILLPRLPQGCHHKCVPHLSKTVSKRLFDEAHSFERKDVHVSES